MTTLWLTVAFTIGFTGIIFAQSNKKVPFTKVTITINAPSDSAFNYIVPVDLSHIFKRYKKLPAIVNTSVKADWTKPGLTRIVYFEDGSTAQESLLTVIPHSSFSYKIEKFTSSLRFLAKRIEGDWLFTDLGNGQTKIEWTYKIIPKHFLARAIINLKVMKDINELLNNAMAILKSDLEGGLCN
jgi:hypothetical protein